MAVPSHIYLELCYLSVLLLPLKHPNSACAAEGVGCIEPVLGSTIHTCDSISVPAGRECANGLLKP